MNASAESVQNLSWPVSVAGMLGHSLATYAHLARFARYSRCARNIPGTQIEAARVIDDIISRSI